MRAYVYTGLVSSNGSRLSSPSISRVSLSSRFSLTLARSRWLQDNQSGRRLPRSGFRSHQTGGDNGGNKELKKRTEKEVACATPPVIDGHPQRKSAYRRRHHGRTETVATVPRIFHHGLTSFVAGCARLLSFERVTETPVRITGYCRKPDFDGRAIMYANGHCASRSGKRESAATMDVSSVYELYLYKTIMLESSFILNT